MKLYDETSKTWKAYAETTEKASIIQNLRNKKIPFEITEKGIFLSNDADESKL